MAHIKTGAATAGNRDSKAKRLGIKVYGGEKVIPGNIIVRQRGTKYHSGAGTKRAKDYTIFAVKEGIVNFKKHWDNMYVEVVAAPNV